MTPDYVSRRVVMDRLEWVDRMVNQIQALPLADRDAFFADSRNVWAAESCLRRALEALFDLGRHILAKGFGAGASEYKEIATKLGEYNVLAPTDVELLRTLAGYRNRLVHFYHEVSPDELYNICHSNLGDLGRITQAYRAWVKANADRVDKNL